MFLLFLIGTFLDISHHFSVFAIRRYVALVQCLFFGIRLITELPASFLIHLTKIRRIWAQLEATAFNGFNVVFDGRRLAFSTKDLGIDSDLSLPVSLIKGSFPIILPEDDGNFSMSKRPPREFRVRIRKAGQLHTREIANFLNNKQHDDSSRFTGSCIPHLTFDSFSDSGA